MIIRKLSGCLVLSGSILHSASCLGTDSTFARTDLHFQATYIYQYKPQFRAPYTGLHSLLPDEEKQNSLTATLYAGARLWKGASIYVDPEVAGGNGLSGAFGMGGSTNGETFRVGNPSPTLYLARAYFNQVLLMGGTPDTLADDQNQLAGLYYHRQLTITIGKYSLGDFFDNNAYSNTPRMQFLNWALMNNAAWDYPANLRGYTTAAAISYRNGPTLYHAAIAAEPKVANGEKLNYNFGMARGLCAEVVRTVTHGNRTGHYRALIYMNEANMGHYLPAIHTINMNGLPDIQLTEKNGSRKYGLCINADQQIGEHAGAFLRAGWNDGKTETWAFTEVDRTLSAGLVTDGSNWKRKTDMAGIAFVANGLSKEHRDYLAHGGLGFQLGDGRLAYAPELITEAYYNMRATNSGIYVGVDYQFAMHPGYNSSRGPVQVFSVRVHAQL